MKTKVRGTSNTLVGDTEIQHQRNRVRLIVEVSCQFNVPTVFTPVSNDLLFFSPMCSAEKVSELINFSEITGIWSPIAVEKNVCQRLPDQVSSLR